MSEPYVAEIKMWACNFNPRQWAKCDGQLLPIAQNTALFSLVGTTYGGDGRTTFGLPDLQGRAAVHFGDGPGLSNYRLGQKGGAETVTLTEQQLPAHAHTAEAAGSEGTETSPIGKTWATPGADRDQLFYGPNSAAGTVDMGANTLDNAGGGQGHNNLMPYQVVNFCIALQGQYPSRN